MIEISELRVTKNGRTICSADQLRVAPGERLAILGPNGSGKTTLLRVLAVLETAYQGHCSVGAAAIDRVFVHQSPKLFRGTVLSNVMYGLRARQIHRGQREQQARDWIERFGLSELSRQSARHLSGGETRRVALARAMVLRPRLLLLDEPLADMDQQGTAAFASALDELPDSTVLVSSPILLPDGLATRTYQLELPARSAGQTSLR